MDGILNVYKEKGCTSFEVTRRLRSLLSEKKIGHTGTLDPMAEGVLVVCAGKATKLVESITGTDKVYEAELLLGFETDTEDITGQVLRECPELLSELTEERVREAALSMIGSYEQLPPMYSAKKLQGKRLYELARQGKTVERKPVRITVHDLVILELALPRLRFSVRCSKGTYVRSICSEIGRKLGCGAVMSALKRMRVGEFKAEDSFRLSEIEELSREGRLLEAMLPPVYVPEDSVVSFGKFDGGHRGHQLIFEKIFQLAEESGRKTALLTFSQNPEAVVKGIRKPGISTAQEHLTRLRNLGFDYVFEFPMTKETAGISAEDFLEKVLVNGMHARDIVVGTDCRFGYRAQGNAELLRALAPKYGYQVHVLKKKEVPDENGNPREISSTFIKEEIARGNVKHARELLGRYFSIAGVVVRGRQIGESVLGFPTANLLPAEGKQLPEQAVYVTRVFIDQRLYRGMTSVGTNPTVSEGNPVSIETYVLDYSGDLYGKKIRVDFVDRIRGQIRFSDMEQLRVQLGKDLEYVKGYAFGEDLT